MKVLRIDHVGVNVNDLPAAKAFFLDLGLELQGEGSLEGAWLDRIVGIDNVKTSLAFFRAPGVPGGQAPRRLPSYYEIKLEWARYITWHCLALCASIGIRAYGRNHWHGCPLWLALHKTESQV